MKFKLLFLLLFLFSCSAGTSQKSLIKPYTSKGFALIYNESDYSNKILSGKLDNNKLQVAHSTVKKNSILRITNPDNKKSIELSVTKKINYPSFFKVVITKEVAKKLDLSNEIPHVDIIQKFKNKSFVAKKAITYSEEKQVINKAPLTKVKIKNISKQKPQKKIDKKFSIIIGVFYSEISALNLRDELEKQHVKKGSLKVKKLGKNKFQLYAGPYKSINTLKKRYFELNKYGFDNLDISQND